MVRDRRRSPTFDAPISVALNKWRGQCIRRNCQTRFGARDLSARVKVALNKGVYKTLLVECPNCRQRYEIVSPNILKRETGHGER